jgi:uncharacterized membrane protein YkoI
MKLPDKFRWLLALLAVATSLAVARPPDDQDNRPHRNRDRTERSEREDRSGREERNRDGRVRIRISLDRAVAMAERRYNARVVRADTRAGGDRIVYVLRLLNDAGRVWTVRVDATTGDMQ